MHWMSVMAEHMTSANPHHHDVHYMWNGVEVNNQNIFIFILESINNNNIDSGWIEKRLDSFDGWATRTGSYNKYRLKISKVFHTYYGGGWTGELHDIHTQPSCCCSTVRVVGYNRIRRRSE